jgi:hypothetical protein
MAQSTIYGPLFRGLWFSQSPHRFIHHQRAYPAPVISHFLRKLVSNRIPPSLAAERTLK